MTTLYVNPVTGSDRSNGSRNAPFKTLTRALDRASSKTTIYLSPGTYSTTTGEKFPLTISEGVTVIGQEADKGENIILLGGGEYNSRTFRRQNIAVLLEERSQLRGVTVSNSGTKGIGVWIESTSPLLASNTLTNCALAGVVVTGDGKPILQDNRVIRNTSTGIFLRRNAKGEVRRNECDRTGYGITISDDSAPLLTDNRLSNNRAGAYLSHNAKPVLRRNAIEKNTIAGIVVKDESQPDLGNAQDPALNRILNNARVDLQNESKYELISAGNELNARRVLGKVVFAELEVDTRTPGPTQFRDVEGHWATDFISGLVQRDILRGFPDGSFQPEGNLSRVAYAAAIAKAFNLPRQLGTRRSFRDVPANYWGAAAIRKATEMGFIAGFGDGTFRPNSNLTRVQALVSLVSGLGLTGGNLDILGLYRDRAQIPSYALMSVAIATEKRLVTNFPTLNRLNPLRAISRGELAAFLYQALVTTGRATPITSPYLVNPDPYLPSFTDTRDHWAQDFIRRLASAELISGFGDGSFKPDDPINRAQYAALLVKSLNPPAIRPAGAFLDVGANFWGLDAINRAYQAGFISGFPDRTFHPNQQLQRLHLWVSLAGGLNLPGGDESLLNRYRDRADIPTYARSAIAAATRSRLIINYPTRDRLLPKQNATRAEAAAAIHQVLVYQEKMSALSSPYIFV
jgi:parallel beta-helix repeat protein